MESPPTTTEDFMASIRCAHCSGRHASVEQVRECAEYQAYCDWAMEAELAAEAANERFFEEGPNGGTYAGSEEEARDRWLDSLQIGA
jgi:hypothetical protein